MDVNVLKYKYKFHFKPHYLHNQSFEDVILLSRDSKEFYINVCIFASLSKLCRELAEGVSKGSIRVQTELSYLELYKVVTFAKTGCLHGYQSTDELDPQILDIFMEFGVDLFRLRFTERFLECKKSNYSPRTDVKDENLKEEEFLDIDEKPFDVIPDLIEEDDIKNVHLHHEKTETGEKSHEDDFIEPSFEPVDDNYCDDDIFEEKPLVKAVLRRKSKKRISAADDEWLPDCEEDQPLRKKAKKKASMEKKAVKSKVEKKTAHSSDHILFDFPQDESLRKKELPFQCHLCVKGFKQKWTLQQHILRHGAKTEKDRFFCLHCHGKYVAFPSMADYSDHVKAQHRGHSLQCPHCDFSVVDKRQAREMNSHIREVHEGLSHTVPAKPKQAICASCGSTLNQKGNYGGLNIHLRRAGPLHDAKCRICPDFEAKTWEENKNHYDTHHNGEVQIKCGFCPAFFRYKTERLDHIKEGCPGQQQDNDLTMPPQPGQPGPLGKGSEERKKEKVVCPHCAKDVSRGFLRNHINAYHGTHRIPCTEQGCNFIIKHPDAVRLHIEQVHVTTQCEKCGWVGPKKEMRRHIHQKHTTNDKKPFTCKECGKGFANSYNFKDHLNIHLGLKPHKCPICSLGFASKATMHGHLRGVHKGIKRK